MCIKLRLTIVQIIHRLRVLFPNWTTDKLSIENAFYFRIEQLTCVVELIISHTSIILSIRIVTIFQQSL